ncbi:polysaccharide deacetylase family protein [Janthinobacterium lividum]|uniref:polysaccharide deacetylase family protein n=1 Tax=Janthinobacterium lividum TaxID=29581 RepID=UPI000874D62D|nr:polysaccharide deacetylase family protein [Janthinobacterium lividum]MCC7713281.1 polysaccharide deacetylase family protein [Janthinobacterium lividum]OEZ61100.1 polysaccharide deacetylase [Janthinobacterium lividum]WQE26349.1 polysaccharide deacetylase family protein [Janthinobacterium lividum]STQ97242.1 polysaccharide deacetylase family sporulation protein PdaB [Janthinobacterium lividum]
MTATLSILIYHRVLARPDPLFPGEVDAALFERQLRLLQRFYTPLPLSDAVRRLQDGSLPPRAACITFDDGYADNAQVALPLLQRHGLHATFFIATGYLDGGQMWNDAVIDAVRHAPGPVLDLQEHALGLLPIASLAQRQAAIATLLGQLKYQPFARRQHLAMQIRRQAGATAGPAAMLSTAQLRQLHVAGMELGAHTASHPILSTLAERAAQRDIAHGKHQLEALIQAPVSLFAYPNGKAGRDYGAPHVAMVKDLGFQAAVATDWGVARPGAGLDLLQLPRFTPWDRGRLAFLWRMRQNRRQAHPVRPDAG